MRNTIETHSEKEWDDWHRRGRRSTLQVPDVASTPKSRISERRTAAKLAALVPKPRVNLTRYHGVFAPNSKHRVWVTPARRGKGNWKVAAGQDENTPAQRHVAMTGFCSCNTGIHAIHGNNLGPEIETGVQY
jgi:hypothetical protein